MSRADRAYVGVRPLFIGVIQAGAEHLGARIELRMDLQADGGDEGGLHSPTIREGSPFLNAAMIASEAALSDASSSAETE